MAEKKTPAKKKFILNPQLSPRHTVTIKKKTYVHGEVYEGEMPDAVINYFGNRPAFVKA